MTIERLGVVAHDARETDARGGLDARRRGLRLILGRLSEAETFDFGDTRFIEDIRGAIRRNLGLSFKFKPVSDLLFVLARVANRRAGVGEVTW